VRANSEDPPSRGRALRNPRASVIVFGVLVAATFAAFFVAQRLKNSPSVVQQFQANYIFSPNHDGRQDHAHVTFKVKKADDVTVEIVNTDGDVVKTLLDDRHLGAYEPIEPSLAWDGTDEDGHEVPDGRYRVHITLRHQGRTVLPQRSILKDTKPPKPTVLSIGPQRQYGPELLPEPGGVAARVHFGPALAKAQITVFRTAPGKVRAVRTDTVAPKLTEWDWDGKSDSGRPVSPGTYVVVPQWRDKAGNVGTGVPLDKAGLPILTQGKLPGHGGITVRYLGVRPPVTPVTAGKRVDGLDVDARQEHYTWRIRRLGESAVRNRSSKPKTSTKVVFAAPGGKSGIYIFEARAGTHQTRVALPVQAAQPLGGTAAKPRGVLVVLPYTTWQGTNPVDDDGDGAPNTLPLGGPARFFRVMAGDGLPQGFTEQEAPLLRWLDTHDHAYDITTDLALVLHKGPRLTGHRGVLIPGDATWLPTEVRSDLRTFARRGGTVVSTGTDSLRRSVKLDPDAAKARLIDPSPERATDLFGSRIAPVVVHRTDLEVFQEDKAIDLFAGGPGLFPGVPAWEETQRAGPDAEMATRAVTKEPPAKSVIVGLRFDKGLVLRPGFPSFAQRLAAGTDPATTALMARMWTLLSR
jgi:flagellar hook assembly protein FlgD